MLGSTVSTTTNVPTSNAAMTDSRKRAASWEADDDRDAPDAAHELNLLLDNFREAGFQMCANLADTTGTNPVCEEPEEWDQEAMGDAYYDDMSSKRLDPAKIAVARAPRVSRRHLRRCCRLSRQGCGSTAAVGREAFICIKRPFNTACDHMLGLTCQRLGPIGQTDVRVHRDGSVACRCRPSRRSGPRIGEDGLGDTFT